MRSQWRDMEQKNVELYKKKHKSEIQKNCANEK